MITVRKQFKKILTGVFIAAMCFAFFGCGNDASQKNLSEVKSLPQGTMVFDYFEQVVGTAVPCGHDEIVLLISTPGTVEIDVYHKPDGEGAVEQCTRYQAPDALVDRVYALIDKYELSRWEEMKNSPVDGLALVIKYRENGEMKRVNAGMITEKYGTKPFEEVYALLREAVGKADLMQ